MEGELVCPETGRKFPVRQGVPNMLLHEDGGCCVQGRVSGEDKGREERAWGKVSQIPQQDPHMLLPASRLRVQTDRQTETEGVRGVLSFSLLLAVYA